MDKRFSPINAMIQAHIHATEDEEKVLEAIRNILGGDIDFDLKREEFTGHHGNPIIRLEISIKNKKFVKKVFENIFTKMSGFLEDQWIIDRFDKRSKKLYLRLDKQKAFLGETKLGYGDDVIRVIFTFPRYMRIEPEELENYINNLRKGPSE